MLKSFFTIDFTVFHSENGPDLDDFVMISTVLAPFWSGFA
jgi:hypothetical protein